MNNQNLNLENKNWQLEKNSFSVGRLMPGKFKWFYFLKIKFLVKKKKVQIMYIFYYCSNLIVWDRPNNGFIAKFYV